MVFKEVSRVEISELIRRWQATKDSNRQLSRATGLSRSTVQKYIHAALACGLQRDGPPPTEKQLTALVRIGVAGPRQVTKPIDEILAPRAERIQRWIQKERLCLTRVQELLKKDNCLISYTSLRRFVAKRGWSFSHGATVRMADTPPGEVAEMDFGRLGLIWDPVSGRRRLAWALLIVLLYSRHCFLWPLFRQQLVDIIEGLEQTWAFFQGMPRYLVLDNFPAAVAGPDPLHPRLTLGFLEYAQKLGFFPDTTRVRHPQDKPHVENSVRFVRERFFKGGEFTDLADLRAQGRHWCLEVAGQRVHGTTRRLPLVVFRDEEQAALLPYSGEPYEVADWHNAIVHQDHHIAYGYAIYSVPDSLCPPGTNVEVRADTKLVRIYHRGALVKVHPRKPRGGRSTDPADYPKALTPYTTRAPDHLRHQAAQLSPAIGAFADRLLGGPLPWAVLRQGHKLLRMAERYTPGRLNAACEKALAVDLIDVRRVEHILKEALEEESLPATSTLPPPPGRFARPGNVFAIRNSQQVTTMVAK
ncbi:MAG: IS21 family transposase [Dehalococcoidia bacterium]|nr:IS21 family transposase [Dehalococcoidia bacterium]